MPKTKNNNSVFNLKENILSIKHPLDKPFSVITHRLLVERNPSTNNAIWTDLFCIDGRPWPNPLRVVSHFSNRQTAEDIFDTLIREKVPAFKTW